MQLQQTPSGAESWPFFVDGRDVKQRRQEQVSRACRRWHRPLLVTARCSTIGCVEGRPFTAADVVSITFAVVGCHANHVVHRQSTNCIANGGSCYPECCTAALRCGPALPSPHWCMCSRKQFHCSGKHAATTRRWAGGNTVNAATTASAEKRLRGFNVDFAAECESWEGSRSNGFFRSVPSGNSFIMQ